MGPYGSLWFKSARPYFIGGLLAVPATVAILYLLAPRPNEEARPDVRHLVLEGCEYLSIEGGSFTHKGNCRNPIHWQGFISDTSWYEQVLRGMESGSDSDLESKEE